MKYLSDAHAAMAHKKVASCWVSPIMMPCGTSGQPTVACTEGMGSMSRLVNLVGACDQGVNLTEGKEENGLWIEE